MSMVKIGRVVLATALIAGYSASIYSLGFDMKESGKIVIVEPNVLNTYKHSHADIQKIRSALNNDISGITAESEMIIPGADCVIYRNDANSEEFHAEVAECTQPNLPPDITTR